MSATRACTARAGLALLGRVFQHRARTQPVSPRPVTAVSRPPPAQHQLPALRQPLLSHYQGITEHLLCARQCLCVGGGGERGTHTEGARHA